MIYVYVYENDTENLILPVPLDGASLLPLIVGVIFDEDDLGSLRSFLGGGSLLVLIGVIFDFFKFIAGFFHAF